MVLWTFLEQVTVSLKPEIRSKIVPSLSEEEMDSFYAELSGCKFKPIGFNLVAPPFAESFMQKSREILTGNEFSNPKYQSCIPGIGALF